MKKNLKLILILLFASLLRLYQLGNTPISMFGDELDVAYQSWSLAKTGRDYFGEFLPTYIHSLSEYRAPFIMYLTAPFVGFFGPSAFWVRLPVALCGVISVYLLYLLVKRLYGSNALGLFAAFLLSITPWHLHYSRAAFEVVPLLCLILLAINSFLSGLFGLSLLFFSLTFFTYSTAYVISPLIFMSLVLIYKLPSTKTKLNTFLIFFSVLLLLLIAKNTFFGQASRRFQSLSVLNSFKVSETVILSRTEPWIKNNFLEKAFNNKYLVAFEIISKNYLSSFSPAFLFSTGDPFFRHSSGRSGELLLVFAPLFLLGFVYLLKNISDPSNKLILSILFISPIASSITIDGANHATRLFLMVLPLVVICSLSLNFLPKKNLNRNLTVCILSIILTINFASYLYNYYYHYRFQSWGYWHYGYEQIFKALAKQQDQYQKVYINNTYQPSLLAFAVYTKLNPVEFQKKFKTDAPGSFTSDQFTGFSYNDKYYFGSSSQAELPKLLTKDTLYLAVQGLEVPGDWNWQKEPPSWAKVLETVYSPLNQPLFYLVTGTK